MDLDTYEVVQRGKIPLPKGATLQWVGFSEEQVPYMYDSTGMLSALDRARRPMQARWVPMLDTNTLARREGKQESYWPVGVHDAFLMCVILKVSIL
jgi:chromosome transmission fidelity protein 4